jgi:multicomponent K+:H+ antiporter subunit E
MRRLIPHPGLSALLLIFWLLLSNSLGMGALVAGIVIAIVLPIFTAPFWPGRPRVDFIAGLAYVALVLRDIVVANFQVAAIILMRRNRDLRATWLVIPMELATPEAITVFAATISLTPGTVSSDVSACGRYLLVHALDAADPAAEIARIKARYETRLQRIFR